MKIDEWLKWQSKLKNKRHDELLLGFKQEIVSKIYLDEEFRVKLRGMLFRNNIPQMAQIEDDVLAEVCYQLMKYDTIKLIDAYCDDYKRVFALSITIATRVGFGKMNADIHPNASVAKQILFSSNINKTEHFCTTTETIVKDGETIRQLYQDIPENIWVLIRSKLNSDELVFLDFLLDNVLNQKYTQSYSRKLRKSSYTFNEYKILRLSLQNKIKDIIKKK